MSGSLSSASTLADPLGTWLSVAALVAAFAVASLLTVSAVSRRVREFGTLKALGWKSRRIVGQVLGESVVVGVAGGVIGVALGIAGARLITALLAGPRGDDGHHGAGRRRRWPARHSRRHVRPWWRRPDGHRELAAPVSLQLVGIAVGLALAGGLLAGALGGWRAARLRPADALRRLD